MGKAKPKCSKRGKARARTGRTLCCLLQRCVACCNITTAARLSQAKPRVPRTATTFFFAPLLKTTIHPSQITTAARSLVRCGVEEFGYLTGLISLGRGFESRPRHKSKPPTGLTIASVATESKLAGGFSLPTNKHKQLNLPCV
jgi:hypothetical protein